MKKWLQKLAPSRLLLALFLLCAAVPAQAAELKIGVILAETGPAALLGGPGIRSLKMLVETLNAAGGIQGRPVELVFRDSGGSPEKAISFAKQLIEEEKVFAIIGPSTSGETLKIKELCEAARTILISCASAELIVNPVARYVFKTAPNDSLAARQIFTTMQAKGISKIAVLAGNDGFGNAGKAQLTKLAPEYGIEILATEVYDKDAKDLSAVVAKMKGHRRSAGRRQLVHRPGPVDHRQEYQAVRLGYPALSEPWFRQYQICRGGGRRGRRHNLPRQPVDCCGEPCRRSRKRFSAHLQEGV